MSTRQHQQSESQNDHSAEGLPQAFIRQVNDEIRLLFRERDVEDLTLLCECGDGSCHEYIVISSAAFESIRSVPNHFVVKRGHVAAQGERVVGTTGSCCIVVIAVGDAKERRSAA